MPDSTKMTADPYLQKGATEDGAVVPVSIAGQLPHRLQPEEMDGQDTDFPGPQSTPEHSGQNETGEHPHKP